MEAVFLRIVNIAIAASWLVLAVILLRFALKKAPKWATCLLWGIVALRLILPFSLESALSLIPNSEPILEEFVITEAPSAQPILPEENQSSTPSVNEKPNASGNQVITPPSSGSLAPTPEASIDPIQVILFIASVVWAFGILAMLGYGTVSYLRLRYRLRASIRQEGRVYLCDNIDMPFILGVFRPRIYLPSDIGESETPYVIAHEEAHLKRKDHLWKPLGFLLLAVYWFNPLFWVAYILLCRDIENACDEKVIKNSDNAYRVGYSEALLSCSIHRRRVMACPVAFGETGVKSRIRAVLHYKKPAFWLILLAVVAIIVTCVCFLTDPVSDKDETTTEVTTEEVPVTTTAPTTTTTTTPTTPEDPDAWKEKVDWESLDNGYNEETDTYQVRIVVQDIYGVGQKRADAAFAEKYGLYYSGKYYYLDYYQFDIIASMKDIEMYAKLEEVKSVGFPLYTSPENPDAWKEKVDWSNKLYSYDAETGKYSIQIFVADIHGVGEKNAFVAFAEQHGLAFNPDTTYWKYVGITTMASMAEIEIYAKLAEVEKIEFPARVTSGDPVIEETWWWQQIESMQGITRVTKADGSVRYRFGLTIHSGSNLFPLLSDGSSTLERIDLTNARVFIKRLQYDNDYTEYKVSAWQVSNLYDLSFEVEGFVPEANVAYDMYLFFTLPEGTPCPGGWCYIWALGEPWTYLAPSVGVDDPIQSIIADSYQCVIAQYNQKYSIEHTNGYANGTPPENFPTSPFSFTISNADGLFASEEAWQALTPEKAFAYIKGENYVFFDRYEIDYMLLEGQGDMWFTLKDFTHVAGESYEIYLFFQSREGDMYYVYANDWIAGVPVDKS